MPVPAGLIASYPTAGRSAVDVRPNPVSPANVLAGCHGCRMANGAKGPRAEQQMRDWAQAHASQCRA
ncbi:hypothetical protein AB0F20_05680 [Streptomyces goshikiensis]|uniref:hypothetical protein n=1 Tax=Streptomyces goshikiensis TaxID=1942 RepID=UPI0033FA3A35